MKLYELERGARIKLETFEDGYDGKIAHRIGEYIIFHHVDGMYSLCTIEGVEENNIVHLGASTELTYNQEGDYYELT